MHKVIFYCESETFGGHQKMALTAHLEMRRCAMPLDIEWVINKQNLRMREALVNAGITYTELDCSPTFAVVRNYRSAYTKLKSVKSTLKRLKPNFVVVIQGGIKESYDGVLACLIAGINFCSYIPMTHRSDDIPVIKMPALRNGFRNLFYRIVARYLTIDFEQARRLDKENPRAKIRVVENYVSTHQAKRHVAGVRGPESKRSPVLGVIGRIEFGQKCQNWLLNQAYGDGYFHDKILLFVGDGPDAAKLQTQIDTLGLRERCRVLGWQQEMADIYESIDVLIVPSRVEGVPLVMIEALGRRIPVVGTDRDGMKTWLPDEWRFGFRNGNELRRSIETALGEAQPGVWTEIERRLNVASDRHRFSNEFYHAISEFIQSSKTQPLHASAIDSDSELLGTGANV